MASNLVEWTSTDLVSLGQELQTKIAKVREQFENRAAQARTEQDIERLRQRLDGLVDQIQDSYQDRMRTMSSSDAAFAEGRGIYNQNLSGLDMDLLVYKGDREALVGLLTDAEFSSTVNRLLGETEPHNARKQLLASGLKLTRGMAPKLYQVADHCRKALQLKSDVEVYVVQDAAFNAACFAPVAKKTLLFVTSALVERFSLRELAFVIGHEMGHYLFEHTRFPIDYILSHGEGYLSPLHAMKLFAWTRSAEVTADRAGLVCCRDFATAANTFFKLSSGITSAAVDFSLQEYLKQLKDIQQEIDKGEGDPRDWFSSHPFSPLRVKALEIFNRSQAYHSLIGKEGGFVSKKELEIQVASLMEIMEPDYLKGDTDIDKKAQHYVLNAGFLVAAANGTVERSELEALAGILGHSVRTEEILGMCEQPLEEVQNKVVELTEEINRLMAPARKLCLIRDMVVISYADGSVDEHEMKCLYWLCDGLEIDTSFVDHVLQSAQRGVD
jgi:Zn-dependent protease with chaperone function/uncharacterized tellurite resistance protein B-like protein